MVGGNFGLTNLAYPMGDVLLLGLVVAGFAVIRQRRNVSWALLGIGLLLNVLGDTAHLFSSSWGASPFGVTLDAMAWPTAIIVMSLAVWVRQRPGNLMEVERSGSFVVPSLAAAAALVILLVGSLEHIGRVSVALAAITLAMVGVRMILSVRQV